MFQRKPQIAILCMSSRRISRNGVSIGLNATYTNINGVENMFCTIEKPKIISLKKQNDDNNNKLKYKENLI